MENSVPAAVCVVANILIVQLIGHLFDLSRLETSTIDVLLTGAIGFRLLVKVAGRSTRQEKTMVVSLGIAFLYTFLFFGQFFSLDSLFTRNVIFYIPLLIMTPKMFTAVVTFMQKFTKKKLKSNPSTSQSA